MHPFTRYLLFQIPGWFVAALVLLGLHQWFGLSPLMTVGLLLLWIIKDVSLYPILRGAYDARVKTGAERLIGTQGEVQRPLAPHGYVRVNGELWRAETGEQHSPILPGSVVRITGARGLTLLVAPNEETARE